MERHIQMAWDRSVLGIFNGLAFRTAFGLDWSEGRKTGRRSQKQVSDFAKPWRSDRPIGFYSKWHSQLSECLSRRGLHQIYILNVITVMVAQRGRDGIHKTLRRVWPQSPAPCSFLSVVSGPAASASLGTFLETQVLMPLPQIECSPSPGELSQLSSLRRPDLDKKWVWLGIG